MGLKAPLTQAMKRLRRSRKRLRKNSAGFATIGLVSTVIGAMTLTLFGVGAVSRALDVYDGNAWFWSAASGSTQRVNLDAGNVDMSYGLKDAKGHDVVIVQSDTHLLLHDRTAGTVTSIALSSLDEGGSLTVQPGTSSSVAMWNDVVVLVDAPKGQIRRLDPESLEAKSNVLQLTPGLVAGGFDKTGHYWVASPTDGSVSAVVAEDNPSGLRVAQEISVTQSDHQLKLTSLDEGVAVIDHTSETVIVVNNGKARSVPVPGLDSAVVAAQTTGSIIAVTVPDSRQVVLIENGEVRTITVDGAGPLGEALVFAGRVYVIDSGGAVLALSTSGELKRRIATSARSTPVTMEQREGALLINEPGGPSGYVVNKNHSVKKVTKYTGSGSGPDTDTASNAPKKKAPEPTFRPAQPRPNSPQPPAPDSGEDPSDGELEVPNPLPSQPAPEPGPGPGNGDQRRAPGAPALENVQADDGRITLDYYPPNDIGGSELTAIDIYCNNSRVLHDTNPGNGKQNASFPAENGVACSVQGYAVNSEGSSAAAIGGTVTPGPATPEPEPTPTPTPTPAPTPTPTPTPTPPPVNNNAVPTGVTATIIDGGSALQVSWNAVSVPAGSQLDNYKVYICIGQSGSCFFVKSSTGTSVTFPRQGEGDEGTARVTSVIDGQESAQSAPSNVFT